MPTTARPGAIPSARKRGASFSTISAIRRARKAFDSAEFRFVRRCLDTGRCWVKLTARFSQQENFPFDDILPFIHHVVERYPDRILWGSDWPHPGYSKPMPNDTDLVDLVSTWVPDEARRRKLFVDNPAELFGFPSLH
jgi:2-pyrone-4,6-dicarboxylate lactonase